MFWRKENECWEIVVLLPFYKGSSGHFWVFQLRTGRPKNGSASFLTSFYLKIVHMVFQYTTGRPENGRCLLYKKEAAPRSLNTRSPSAKTLVVFFFFFLIRWMISLLHGLSGLILVFGITNLMPTLSPPFAFWCLRLWWYTWYIYTVVVLGFLWGFGWCFSKIFQISRITRRCVRFV